MSLRTSETWMLITYFKNLLKLMLLFLFHCKQSCNLFSTLNPLQLLLSDVVPLAASCSCPQCFSTIQIYTWPKKRRGEGANTEENQGSCSSHTGIFQANVSAMIHISWFTSLFDWSGFNAIRLHYCSKRLEKCRMLTRNCQVLLSVRNISTWNFSHKHKHSWIFPSSNNQEVVLIISQPLSCWQFKCYPS